MKSTYKNLSLLGIALPPIGSRAMPSKDGLTHFSEHSPRRRYKRTLSPGMKAGLSKTKPVNFVNPV